ncbi:MAG: DUF512 domain-containing protein [candidate division KSB1 bacterium]|nr:DUF512 domain-containing protein [candidate division KSB1 bacterium]
MKILKVKHNSPAKELGIQVGDLLLSINDHPIRDILDYHFYRDDNMDMLIERNGELTLYEIEGDDEFDLGLDFKEMTCKGCGNHCVFCFVDQNPPHVRSPLLFKDEDYRMSFLYGNYVTLTNFSKKDIQRIAEQHLSPLYISVHALDPKVRQKMLGLKRDDCLIEKLNFLAAHQIEMHAQIVLCPGFNDGEVLEDTIHRLSMYYPWIKTVAVVPVGLTGHRDHLTPISPVTPRLAGKIIDWIEAQALGFRQTLQSNFVYLADEFYILAARPLPRAERYEDFHQIENGVGMTRKFLDDFEQEIQDLPKALPDRELVFVTGELAVETLEQRILPELNAISGLSVRSHPVKNQFFGGGVTVSGLLTGRDIAHSFGKSENEVVVLPPNCLNYNDVFLDDWTMNDLSAELNRPLVQFKYSFAELLKRVQN